MLQQGKNLLFYIRENMFYKKSKWLFILFFGTSISRTFLPTAHTWFGLELSNCTKFNAGKNSRVSVPADCWMHQHSHSLNTKQISTTTWGELNSFENLSQKFKPKIPNYSALGCFGETVQSSMLHNALTPGKCDAETWTLNDKTC